MTDEIRPCPKCELPLDPRSKRAELHEQYCIGQTPYVLHNRKAGMVVYLSEEEWTDMEKANQAGVDFPEWRAAAIASRAVFGLEDPTAHMPAEG